jgi:hypothetical protein
MRDDQRQVNNLLSIPKAPYKSYLGIQVISTITDVFGMIRLISDNQPVILGTISFLRNKEPSYGTPFVPREK